MNKARILDQVYLHELPGSAHLSEVGVLCSHATAMELIERGHDPAAAFELAYDESKHPRKSDGKFAPKGEGESNSKTDSDEVDRAYQVRPGGFVKRDKKGNPLSAPVGNPSEFHPAPQMSEAHAAAAAQRHEAGRKIDPALKVSVGPEQPGENLQCVTHADTPEVMRVRAAITAHKEAWQKEHGVADTSELDTPERHQLRKEIIRDLYGNGAAKKERKVFLITGPPGSGKSTLVKQRGYLKNEGALEIDSDMAKEQLPEFNGGRGADLVHEESSQIGDAVLHQAMLNGDNIVHPIVGKTQESLLKKIKAFQDAGYTVSVDNLHLSGDRSMESVVSRFHRNGRYVPPEYAYSVDSRPKMVHETIVKEGLAEGVEFNAFDSDDVIAAAKKLSENAARDIAELYD